MKHIEVAEDAFKDLKCCKCDKPLDDEPQIVEDHNLVGKYVCLNCYYKSVGRFLRRGIDY